MKSSAIPPTCPSPSPLVAAAPLPWRVKTGSRTVTEFQPGDLVDNKYEVKRLIRKGGMGSVYEVVHLGLNVPRALKVMACEPSQTEIQRFRREAQIVANINDPSLVRIYDYCPSFPYIEMELVPGCSVSDLLEQDQRLSLELTAVILKPFCQSVGLLHRHGIVHRDIKPSNAMFDNTSQSFKLIDYGIAVSENCHRCTYGGQYVGSLPYSSPEQISSSRDANSLFDIFSLGVTLYQCLTGTLPFSGLCRNKPLPMPKQLKIPREIESLVKQCLAKNPTRRPQSAAEIWSRFHQVLCQGLIP